MKTVLQKIKKYYSNSGKVYFIRVGVIFLLIITIIRSFMKLHSHPEPITKEGISETITDTVKTVKNIKGTEGIKNSDILGFSINGYKSDLPTLTAGVYKKGHNMDWQTVTNAKIGDDLNFKIYYHNTSQYELLNLTVAFHKNIVGNRIYAFASIKADETANGIQGECIVNVIGRDDFILSEGQVFWFPNQSIAPMPYLNGQTGKELNTDTGLYLGTINPGWSTQGSVVFSTRIQKRKF